MSLVVRSRARRPAGWRSPGDDPSSATAASSSIGAFSDRPAGVPELDAGAHVVLPGPGGHARPHQRSRARRLGGLRTRDPRRRGRRRDDARGHAAQQHSGDDDGCRPRAEARRRARAMSRRRGLLGRRRAWQCRRPRAAGACRRPRLQVLPVPVWRRRVRARRRSGSARGAPDPGWARAAAARAR